MNNDLMNRLETAYHEEVTGHDKYVELSRIAKEQGECKISKILKDMACEEKSHAKMLCELMGKEM